MPFRSNSRPRVVLTHWVHPEVIDWLRQYYDVIPNETRDSLPREVLMERCREADGIMVFMPDRVDEAFLRECPNLRVISAALKGYDNFDVEACQRRGVRFYYVADLLTIPTAELAVGLMITLGRKIVPGDAFMRTGDFEGWRPRFYGRGLDGARVGLVGCGAVGRALAQRLQGFDCDILAWDREEIPPSMQADLKIRPVNFETLISQSDFVVLLLPLTSETRHLIDHSALERFRPGTLLVNVCRGSIVDEEAVADALESGRLGGYAADVFEMEDWALEDRPDTIPDPLLQDLARTVFTPHLGSAVEEVRKRIAMEAALNLKLGFEVELEVEEESLASA